MIAWVVGVALAGDWSGQAHLVTDVPVQLGVRAQVEGPLRLRANTSVGWMPAGYVDVLNAVVVGFGGYTPETAALIDAALQDSLVWRAHVGWRPLDAGWFVEAGYGLVTLGGGVGAAEVVEAATGRELGDGADAFGFDVKATAHMVDVVSGWEQAHGAFVWRVDLGGSFTTGARSSVDRQFPASRRAAIADALELQAEALLDDTLKRWGHTPTVGLAVGVRWPVAQRTESADRD